MSVDLEFNEHSITLKLCLETRKSLGLLYDPRIWFILDWDMKIQKIKKF